MASENHLYETTFIVNASLEDPHIENMMTRIQEVITRNGGEIKAMNRWGRKRMMYAVRKKNNGYYTNIEFTAPPTLSRELERFYVLEENILRFLTIRVDKRAMKAREIALSKVAAEVAAANEAAQAAPPVTLPAEDIPPVVR